MIPLDSIREAAARIGGKLHRTPLVSSRILGERAGVELHLKCECYQKTGSFKPRGALNKVLSLAQAGRARGPGTVSARNHAPALGAGHPIPVPRPAGTLADGMTPPFVGALPLEIARTAVDQVVAVTEDEIVDAIQLLITRAKLYVEGSGAAATAALLSGKVKVRAGARVAAIVSGGNIHPERVLAAPAAGPATRAQTEK